MMFIKGQMQYLEYSGLEKNWFEKVPLEKSSSILTEMKEEHF